VGVLMHTPLGRWRYSGPAIMQINIWQLIVQRKEVRTVLLLQTE
jgi:hypothetical protein